MTVSTAPLTPPASPHSDYSSKCLGLSSFDSPSRMVHPRARELAEHLRAFPWDISCLTYVRCRHEIFPEVFSGKASTTKIVEYLVELRFLIKALKGWTEVSLGRSPHHMSPLDKRFIVYSIATSYHELPDLFKELLQLGDRTYSSAVKKYCDEVREGLNEFYMNPEVKALCENINVDRQYQMN